MNAAAMPVSDDGATERLIRRYANRKLYDTVERRFTSLRQIERLIRDGENIRVEDHETGADMTAHFLGRVLSNRDSTDLPLAELIRMPNRIARIVVEDRHEQQDELRDLRAQIDELTRVVSALISDADTTRPAKPAADRDQKDHVSPKPPPDARKGSDAQNVDQ
ncbi:MULTISPECIES: polyhydroxyalkanoate synthesis regulator DNA-binding domain-containing protein [unclassified Frankia]|uniref:polyhydroxyalkanoate synthesis regulator DNA-binding domain-containing protein n=1 Tax=unclassified Frankia TaxID=2632575 RepID=UPI002024EED9